MRSSLISSPVLSVSHRSPLKVTAMKADYAEFRRSAIAAAREAGLSYQH